MKRIVLIAMIFSGCKTDAPVTRVKESGKNKEIEVYDSADEKSVASGAKTSKSIAQAIKEVLERLKEKPNDPPLLTDLANLLLVQGKVDEARKAAKTALRYDMKSVSARKTLASIEVADHNFDLATIILNGLGGETAKDSQVLNLLGLMALRREQYDESLSLFKTALKHNGEDLAVRMNLGVIYLKYRQLAPAQVQFERVLQIMPEHQDAQLHLAIIKVAQGKAEEADKLYRDILSANSNNALAHYDFALLLRRDEAKLEEAKKNVEAYLDSDKLTPDGIARGKQLSKEISDLIAERERKKREAEEKERQALAAKKAKENAEPDTKPAAAQSKPGSGDKKP